MTIAPKSLTSYDLQEWLNSSTEKPIIIDVREAMELEIASFPYTDIHIPMSQVTKEYIHSSLDKYKKRKIVVFCHMGVRSYCFAEFLLDNNYVEQVWNLEGGIDGWSRNIDLAIPRY